MGQAHSPPHDASDPRERHSPDCSARVKTISTGPQQALMLPNLCGWPAGVPCCFVYGLDKEAQRVRQLELSWRVRPDPQESRNTNDSCETLARHKGASVMP